MKEVQYYSQGRHRMQQPSHEAVLSPPVNMPNSRRLIKMQQLELYEDFDQVQDSAVDHHVNNDHSLQEVSADDHDHETLTNRSLLRAKYGLTTQNNAAYNDNHLEKHPDEDPEEPAANHLQQHESAAAADYCDKMGSENVLVLRAKNRLSNHSFTPRRDHHFDQYGERYMDDHHRIEEEVAAEHGPRTAPATLKATKSHRAYNSHLHDKHVERYAVNHQLMEQDSKANHKRSGITSSTLQAAHAQAAELRALHSAMLNNYGFADRNTAAYNSFHHKQKQEDANMFHNSRPTKACKKKSKVYGDDDQEVQNPLSSTSSASSTADCFIFRPAHEYPIFTPSHEDMNSLNHRSSVDTYEALMREERLNYIFDHDNKRSFSGIQFSDRSKRDHSVSCLHESLNLPPRSASSLTRLQAHKDDRLLHHMSLNLPPGSQHHLLNQNSLLDNFNPSEKKASYIHPMNAVLDGSSYSSSVKRFNDGNLHDSAVLDKPMDQTAYEFKPAFTGRQRALLEFLSEEPARMRAFNELAATSEIPQHEKVQSQTRSNRRNHEPSLAEGNLSSSRRIKGKFESTQTVDRAEFSSSTHHPRHQSMPHPSHSTAPMLRQKVVHPDHSDQIINSNAGVSFDKCRPIAAVNTVVVPLTDSRDLGADHLPANTAAAAPKEKSDQKKPSIKGWFFRGKKKHNNADLSNHQANSVDSTFTSKDQNPIRSAASSTTHEEKQSSASLTTKEKLQSSASTTSTTAATSSHVFSGLINSEAEKELEVAMAMDLMELKILQANTKRDAAMAEVLELRLAMDSMAMKLVEVERHCEVLRTQLVDVQALHHQDDQMLADHLNNARAAAEIIATADQLYVNSDDPGASEIVNIAEEIDHYESDSIDHREERRPSKGISTIRSAGLSSGYGGRSSSRSCVQPTQAEFLNAVAETRVGIRQVSRVLLQHIQESKGAGGLLQVEPDDQKAGPGNSYIEEDSAGGTAAPAAAGGLIGKTGRERENWGPIMIMCREAAKGDQKAGMSGGVSSGSRGRGVAYCVEAVISMAFHEHFENVGFDKNGAHKILDPSQRALAFYHSFLKLAKLTPTQLLTQPSPLYNSAFDHFCSRKMRALSRAVGCPGRLWPDELARTFLSAARAVWLLHHLAFAYHGRPPGIFRVAAQSSFDARFMEVLPTNYLHLSPSSHLLVSLMVMPGFFLPDGIIKCKVLAR